MTIFNFYLGEKRTFLEELNERNPIEGHKYIHVNTLKRIDPDDLRECAAQPCFIYVESNSFLFHAFKLAKVLETNVFPSLVYVTVNGTDSGASIKRFYPNERVLRDDLNIWRA